MFGYLSIQKSTQTEHAWSRDKKVFKLSRFILFCCTQSLAQSYTHRTCLYIYRKLALIIRLVIPKISKFCLRRTVLLLVVIIFL